MMRRRKALQKSVGKAVKEGWGWLGSAKEETRQRVLEILAGDRL